MVDGTFIPEEIFKQAPSLIKQVLSLSTWNNLAVDQKTHLLRFLPKSFTIDEKEETVNFESNILNFSSKRSLFSGDNLIAFPSSSTNCSTNPVDDFLTKFQSGYYSKEAIFVRSCQKKAIKARAKYLRSRYYHELLKELIVSHQCHLAAVTFPKCFELVKHNFASDAIRRDIQVTLQKSSASHYQRILHEVKQDVAKSHDYTVEDLLSSDTDDDQPKNTTTRAGGLEGSLFTSNKIKELLIQHKRRRDAKICTPDLNTHGIKLIDVCSRVYGAPKKTSGLLRKKRRAENVSYSRQKKLKFSKQKENKKEKRTFAIKEKRTITSPSCFFELIRDVIRLTADKSLASIQLLICDWLASAEASRYDWTGNFTNGDQLILSGLQFLNNRPVKENQDCSLIKQDNDTWSWSSSLTNAEEVVVLQDLCREWYEQVSDRLRECESTDGSADNPFHQQERRRFMYAHQAFVYNISGSRYSVPPVKGTAGPTREGRVAREHCLLQSERPPQVTLLALTRDAVARLPERRGTRSLVCELVKESQYLAPGVTDAQINAAVSGALDRLHYELDPCVKYDSSAKVWLYLHAHRSPEDLERIHAEQLGAPKRKRERISKKPKQKNIDKKKIHKEKRKVEVLKDITRDEHKTMSSEAMEPVVATGDAKSAKQTEKSTSTGVNDSPVFSSVKQTGTRTIQVSQRQLLEMTRSLMKSGSVSDAREVLGGGKPTEGNPPSSSQGQLQSGLKLILKPAGADPQKPVAELVRVLEPSGHSHGNQQVLSADALRRLTEQLSAMSSRPIKIVQRNITSPSTTSNFGSRVINIAAHTGAKNKLASQTNTVLSSTPTSGHVSRNSVPQESAQTVYISRIPSGEASTHPRSVSKSAEESRVLHIVHRGPKNTTRTIEVGSNSSRPTNTQMTASNSQAALHILSGGKMPVFRPSGDIGASQTKSDPSMEKKDGS